MKERRKQRRYKIRNGGYVFFQRDASMAGRIEDFSAEGAGFSYFASRCQIQGFQFLHIAFEGCHLHVEGVMAQTAWEKSLPQAGESTYVRRCGVQFESLTQEQRQKIDEILANCTVR